jgi:GNAT superfamily N-acetyltransferase
MSNELRARAASLGTGPGSLNFVVRGISAPGSLAETLAYPSVNLGLAQRLESAEAMANAAYVETRRELCPSLGATWIQVAGAHALFDGVSSPLTQTFGVGIFEPVGDVELEMLEAFFTQRGTSTFHEVSSFATPNIWNLLSAHGYTPIETSTVLFRSTAPTSLPVPGRIVARVIKKAEAAVWSRVMGEGVASESAEFTASMEDLGWVMTRAPGAHCFLAELEGEPIAEGIMIVRNGVALLGGASTIPAARRQGAQLALMQARLNLAAALGIDLAMLVAQPGSSSLRNAERQGFRPAYMRSKWQRSKASASLSRGQ